jgi:hypothetical protein
MLYFGESKKEGWNITCFYVRRETTWQNKQFNALVFDSLSGKMSFCNAKEIANLLQKESIKKKKTKEI